MLSQGIIFVLRGDESAQRAPKDKKFLLSRSTEVPKKFPAAPKDKNDPFGQQSPTWGTKQSVYPPKGHQMYLVSLTLWKNWTVRGRQKVQKKLAKEENVPGEDAKSVQNFSQSIFLYTKARLALWGSVPLDSMFYSDFDVKLLVWFVYIRLIFLIFWLILRSHRRSKAFSPRLRVLNFLILGSETKIKSSEFLNLRLRDVD